MAITETRFKDRLKGKHKLIDFSIEEKRDYENLQRIMKVLAEQGALIGSAIRQKLCCKQYHPGNPNQKVCHLNGFFNIWLGSRIMAIFSKKAEKAVMS